MKNVVEHAQIASLTFFSVCEWQSNKSNILNSLTNDPSTQSWIVRSSCSREDSINLSNAGAFLSILNVTNESLEAAICKVIDSYGEIDLSDEILVQPMLTNVVRSGVAFSHDPNTCSPYRVVNWSDSENTSIVTGGMGGRVWQQAAKCKLDNSNWLKKVINLLEELYGLLIKCPSIVSSHLRR